ncbi:hypothetical protein F4556_007552 [Kitasatospora gansuensis]|uniref:Uncharacterized protein n=1 Tax=Kitasatospora gansuensis TaxID=258050 RepID=A0A7W7WM32_9ACTN|nr:hypothetical protein [Kitasatospora gansuensis]MBB4951898.1 hypothetical protein [Kitasatospora gansuensis]
MTGDRHDAAGPARRTWRQKMTAWLAAWYSRHPGTVVIGGFLLLVAAVFFLIGQGNNGPAEPCPPSKVCNFVR